MARVKLDNIGKVYENGYRAVRAVSFEAAHGELLVLVGPSGCGKSTTLRMIAGLESISEGNLFIGDRLVNGVPPKSRDIAMVFQNYALYPHMTVYENLAFGLKLRKLAKSEIEGQVRRAAAILGLEAILGRKPRELSGGQRQRVAVGRAIVRKPQVFLFDEPLSNLDAKLRVQTRKEISKLHQQLEATMIYVTHDQVEAMTLGDRIVVMHEGVVQQIDAPLDLYHRPANLFVAGFIGSPAMNLIPGHIRVGDGRTFEAWAGALRVRIDSRADGVPAGVAGPAGREVVLGVRPEDVQVDAVADRPDHGGAQLRLDLVEPMGNELFVYASRNDHEVVARVPPQPLPRPGSSISVRFDPAKLHLFDPLTEQRIDPRAS